MVGLAIVLIYLFFGTNLFSTNTASAAWYMGTGVWTYRKMITT